MVERKCRSKWLLGRNPLLNRCRCMHSCPNSCLPVDVDWLYRAGMSASRAENTFAMSQISAQLFSRYSLIRRMLAVPLSPAVLKDRLATFPRAKLAFLPTPLEACVRLSRELGGPDIFIKRDDLTGLAFGGNKTRQLELLAAVYIRALMANKGVAGTTRCRAGRQDAASRQASSRLLRCAPALRVTRPNVLTHRVFMAGSELPATSRPICENTSSPEVNPHILCSPFIRGFSQPPTRVCVRGSARRQYRHSGCGRLYPVELVSPDYRCC